MSLSRHYTCDVCGEFREAGQQWFLVTENRWGDTVDILNWDPVLAGGAGVRHVCSTGHLHALLARWMRTGVLEHCHDTMAVGKSEFSLPFWSDEGRMKAAQIGEVSIDRTILNGEATDRGTLMSVLDAIEAVLEDNVAEEEQVAPSEEGVALIFDA